MTERPILFSAPMVRAILEGRKTQTRRVVKPQPDDRSWIEACVGGGWMVVADGESTCGSGVWDTRECAYRWQINCPFAPGMRLWVRETWLQWECPDHGQEPCQCTGYPAIRYRADGEIPAVRWRSGIHMSRWASRILLEVTAVRVERLQDISERDARAEGVEPWARVEDSVHWDCDLSRPASGWWRDYSLTPEEEMCGVAPLESARQSYETLWEQIHGPGSWDANPWVWCVEFRRIEP